MKEGNVADNQVVPIEEQKTRSHRLFLDDLEY